MVRLVVWHSVYPFGVFNFWYPDGLQSIGHDFVDPDEVNRRRSAFHVADEGIGSWGHELIESQSLSGVYQTLSSVHFSMGDTPISRPVFMVRVEVPKPYQPTWLWVCTGVVLCPLRYGGDGLYRGASIDGLRVLE